MASVNSEQKGARTRMHGTQIKLFMCAQYILLRIYYKKRQE